MISVLIVDDHGVVREGLARLVATFAGVAVAGTAVNGEQAVAFCARSAPEIVLMDLEMPVLDGIEATRRIVAAHPGTRVIALTSFSADRRDKRDYQVHLRGGKAIEAVCFPIAGDRRPASVR